MGITSWDIEDIGDILGYPQDIANVSWDICFSDPTVAGLRAGIHNDTNALKLPPYLHPAPPPTPSPHLICGFAPYTLRHPTSALPLSLCPSTAPRVRVRVRAVSRRPSARQLINKPTALPYRIRVPFFTVRVRYWPRPASSAPALFILVATKATAASHHSGPSHDSFMRVLYVFLPLATVASHPPTKNQLGK